MNNRTIICCLFLIPALAYVQGCAALTESVGMQQLQSDYQALKKQQADLAQMQAKGNLSERDRSDFETWIKQQQRQLADACRKQAGADGKLPANPPCEEIIKSYPVPVAINTRAEKTEAEKTADMLQQFNGSLGEFDEKLLREQERVKAKSPRTSSSQSAGGSSGAGNGDQSSSGSGSSDSGDNTGQKDQDESTASNSGDHRQTNNDKPGSMGKTSTTPSYKVPEGIPDGRNDDVIARQLREAAETEADPELRKKLWDEYRRYKAGSLK